MLPESHRQAHLDLTPITLISLFVFVLMTAFAPPADPPSATWTFDHTDRIGGHTTTLLGHPRVIDSPVGKAIEFNGVDDGLFVDVHPLAGAATFTWDVIFRPDADGPAEQRFFHL